MTPKRVAYATADLHAAETHDGPLWADIPETSGDIANALTQVVALCVRDNADLYLAGDNFDGPDPHPRAVDQVYRILRPLANANSGVYYVLGNHDRGRDWLSPFGPHAIRVDGQKLQTKAGHTITGLSFTDPAEFLKQVATVPPTAVGLYHQSLYGFSPGGRGIPETSLPHHKLAIVGDIHIRKVFKPLQGPSRILSPGPLVPQSIAEFEPSVVWAVYDDFTVEAVPIQGRQFIRYDIATEYQAEAVALELAKLEIDRSLPATVRQPLVQVKLTTSVPGAAELFHKLAKDRGFLLRISEDKAKIGRQQQAAYFGPRGLLAAIAASSYPDPVKTLASRMVAPGANPEEILAERLREVIRETSTT